MGVELNTFVAPIATLERLHSRRLTRRERHAKQTRLARARRSEFPATYTGRHQRTRPGYSVDQYSSNKYRLIRCPQGNDQGPPSPTYGDDGRAFLHPRLLPGVFHVYRAMSRCCAAYSLSYAPPPSGCSDEERIRVPLRARRGNASTR